MESQSEQDVQVQRDLSRLRAQVHGLRLVVLRAPALIAVVLITIGSVLPAWHDVVEDDPQTLRVAALGFQALAEPGGGFGVALGIGFLGLLVVLLLLCGVLLNSVVRGYGRAKHERVRLVIAMLAVLGSTVATLFSLWAAGSSESDVSGGAGPLVVLIGVVLGVVVMRHRPWHDLWTSRHLGPRAHRSARVRRGRRG